MKKNYILVFVFLCFFKLNFAQQEILCPIQKSGFKIENLDDVPSISDNGDGTITVTHSEQYITDIFANYTVYNFYQTNPTGSVEAQMYYNIEFKSKSLINNLIDNITDGTFEFIDYYEGEVNHTETTIINPEIITALDNNTLELKKWLATSDGDICDPCPLYDVPDDFSLTINCSYNPDSNMLTLESNELTPCGNAFSIKLTGGNPNEIPDSENILQLWESIPGTSSSTSFSEPCHDIEKVLYSLLGIACFNMNYGNIQVIIDSNTNSIQFKRQNTVFGQHILEFSEANLTVEDFSLLEIKPFKTINNPYLQISNSKNQALSIEILSVSGQIIFEEQPFENNTVLLSNFSNGLYFIKIKTLNNQQKIFKFLNN